MNKRAEQRRQRLKQEFAKIDEKKRKKQEKPKGNGLPFGIRRRDLISHGLTAGALLTLGYMAVRSEDGEAHAESFGDGFTERDRERLNTMKASPLFNEELEKYLEDYRTGELELVLSPENGRHPTLGDAEGRSRIDYVHQELMNGVTDAQLPAHMREELSFYVVGMFAQESKYQNHLQSDNTLDSDDDALFISQAVPSTFEHYGYTEAQMRHLSTQVELTRRMFIDYYNMLWADVRPALEKIKERCFKNRSQEEFEREFVALCVVNAYQAGIGNMQTVIRVFADGLSEHPPFRKYNVFAAMSDAAKNGGYDPHYREESCNYVKQSAAFAYLLRQSDTEAVRPS